MSIEERLISAFNGLVPAASQTYKGDEDEYITINYTASCRCITSRLMS